LQSQPFVIPGYGLQIHIANLDELRSFYYSDLRQLCNKTAARDFDYPAPLVFS